eukprot:505275_1
MAAFCPISMYHIYTFIFLPLSITLPLVWNEALMPIPNFSNYQKKSMAVGIHLDSIWLLGGYGISNNEKELWEFNPITNNLTQHSNNILLGNFASQCRNCFMNDVVYMADATAQVNITSFNLSSQTSNPTIIFPNSSFKIQCITCSSGFIFVTTSDTNTNQGGYVSIYNMNNNQWMDAPRMGTHIIYGSSFIAHKNILYFIGGWDTFGTNNYALSSVQILNVSNVSDIMNQNWKTLNDNLTTPRLYHSSVVYNDLIYVIGGLNTLVPFGGIELMQVDVINTINQTIIFDSMLKTAIRSAAVGIIDNVVYLIGGFPHYDTYQFAALNTLSPTLSPSFNPTIIPTLYPALYPTTTPTLYPTLYPTKAPYIIPTNIPSYIPTVSPVDDAPVDTEVIIDTTEVLFIGTDDPDDLRIVIIVCIVILMICFSICIIVYYKKRKNIQRGIAHVNTIKAVNSDCDVIYSETDGIQPSKNDDFVVKSDSDHDENITSGIDSDEFIINEEETCGINTTLETNENNITSGMENDNKKTADITSSIQDDEFIVRDFDNEGNTNM